MKTIFKIIVILTVAVLIGGLFYGVVTAASGIPQTALSDRPLPPEGQFAPLDREETDGRDLFPGESIKSLAIISIIAALYLNLPRWIARKRLPVKTTL